MGETPRSSRRRNQERATRPPPGARGGRPRGRSAAATATPEWLREPRRSRSRRRDPDRCLRHAGAATCSAPSGRRCLARRIRNPPQGLSADRVPRVAAGCAPQYPPRSDRSTESQPRASIGAIVQRTRLRARRALRARAMACGRPRRGRGSFAAYLFWVGLAQPRVHSCRAEVAPERLNANCCRALGCGSPASTGSIGAHTRRVEGSDPSPLGLSRYTVGGGDE